MKKMITAALLLASVASPVLAQDRDWHREGDRRGGDHRDGGYRDGDHRDGYRGGPVNGGWNNGWRNDNRFRWEDYRRDNRAIFALPRFLAPRGYAYRRWEIGVNLPTIFFGPRYWISNPYAYRLPPAPFGTHWIRHFSDALLVQNRTGRVIDAVYGIFY